jgi:heme exporter protein C
MSFLNLANPHRFQKLACVLIPILAIASMLLIGLGLFLGFGTPTDYQQGEMVRVMYIDVPFAWLSLGAYAVTVAAALGTLVRRNPLADVAGTHILRLAAANGEMR